MLFGFVLGSYLQSALLPFLIEPFYIEDPPPKGAILETMGRFQAFRADRLRVDDLVIFWA